jgi:bacillithiol system protein YtxJ
MGFFTTKISFPWVNLTSKEEFNSLWESDELFLVFKHSTRCAISSMALRNFEVSFKIELVPNLLFLDLIKYREISNHIAETTNVIHQSPQLILIKNKQILHTASHENIDANKIEQFI